MCFVTRLALGFALVFGLLAAASAVGAAEQVQFPIQVVNSDGTVTVATGIFRNNPRFQQRRQQRQGQPAPGERTQPVDPNATPPLNGGVADGEGGTPSVQADNAGGGLRVQVELTPEQKTQIFEAIKTFILALLAVFTANSTNGGVLGGLLSKIGVPGVTPPAPAPEPAPEPAPAAVPTSVRKRAPRKAKSPPAVS